MASIAMDDDDDYLHLPPVEEEDSDDDYVLLEEDDDEDIHELIRPEDFVAFCLRVDLEAYRLADLIEQDPAASNISIPGVGVGGDSDDSQLALAVSEALKTVEAPHDDDDDGRGCPICLVDDDTAVWKETPCGHRFHGRCVERWLHATGSCPMCRHQVVTRSTADVTNIALFRDQLMVILENYGGDAAIGVLQWLRSLG
jgi:hypothetical protein